MRPAAALLALLLPLAAHAAGGGGHGTSAEPPADEGGFDPDPPSFTVGIVPSYHAIPADIVAAMRLRILEKTGVLPEPISQPEPADGGGHGGGH